MSRTSAREAAMRLVYQWSMNGGSPEEAMAELMEDLTIDDVDHQYIDAAITGVEEHLRMIDQKIESYAVGWTLGRLNRVDLSILRLAIYELLWSEDVPVTVAINEAVELSKQYGTDDSPAFVNGILANFYRKELEGK